MAEVVEKPYAQCSVCEITLATKEDAREHSRATLEPTGATGGVTARGHKFLVLNPTREEIVQRIVERVIDDACEAAFTQLDRDIKAGRITQDEVTKALAWYDDFAGGWADWIEGDRTDG